MASPSIPACPAATNQEPAATRATPPLIFIKIEPAPPSDYHTLAMADLVFIATCLANQKFNVSPFLSASKEFRNDPSLWDAAKDVCGPRGKTRLMYAAIRGDARRARWLLARGAKVNARASFYYETALYYASAHGNHEVVEVLLAHGANPNLVQNYLDSPLRAACGGGYQQVVQLLLYAGADPNYTRNFGLTPLTHACSQGNLGIIELLLSHGARINDLDPCGWTALMYSVLNNSDSYLLLLDRGADINATSTGGENALCIACKNKCNSKIETLIQRGAYMGGLTVAGCPLIIYIAQFNTHALRLFIEYGADVNTRYERTWHTPLIQACIEGNVEAVEILLHHGADMHARARGGMTPLLLACNYGHAYITFLLLSRRADVNIKASEGSTPLLIACNGGHEAIVTLLLDHNACLTDTSIEGGLAGFTPLMLAAKKGNMTIVKQLLHAGADPNVLNYNMNAREIAQKHNHHAIADLIALKSIPKFADGR